MNESYSLLAYHNLSKLEKVLVLNLSQLANYMFHCELLVTARLCCSSILRSDDYSGPRKKEVQSSIKKFSKVSLFTDIVTDWIDNGLKVANTNI